MSVSVNITSEISAVRKQRQILKIITVSEVGQAVLQPRADHEHHRRIRLNKGETAEQSLYPETQTQGHPQSGKGKHFRTC